MIVEALESLFPTLKRMRQLAHRSPKMFALISILGLLSYIAVFYLFGQLQVAKMAAERAQNPSFEAQLANLKQTEESLKGLITYVEAQRTKLKESEDILNNLNAEKQKLEPLVHANRDVVKAIFDAQEEIHARNVWIGYLASFVLGVLLSLVASVLVRTFKMPKSTTAID